MKHLPLKHLINLFDIFLVDQFGVLIDGNGACPGAVDALTSLIKFGRTVVVLTNSGKRASHTVKRLEHSGFPPLQVVSSGETAHNLLIHNSFSGQIKSSGPINVWYEAENQTASPLEGLDANYVDTMGKADLLILAGVRESALSAYKERFQAAIERGLPCLCTNPDLVRLTADGPRFGVGQIAKLYEEMGGQVQWIGKPHRAIYDHALRLVPKQGRVVCIGDSLAHDIVGAQSLGMQTALVRSGLSADLSMAEIEETAKGLGAMPDFIVPQFSLD